MFAELFGVAQISDVRFRQVTIEDGLSQSSVYSIYQDYRGFIWFGTFDGLNRYDGRSIYKFLPYANDDQTQTLTNGDIWGLDGNRKSKLYIATMGGGLNVLNYDDCKITYYKHTDSASIIENNLRDVKYVDDTTVWVVAEKGVSRFNPADKSFHNYPFVVGKSSLLSGVRGNVVFVDKNKNVWIGTYGAGILKLDPKNGHYQIYRNDLCESSVGDYVRDIASYQDSLMLVAAKERLYIFNPRTGVYSKHHLDAKDLFGVVADDKGNYWVASALKGVYCIEKSGDIKEYLNDYYDPYSFPDNMTVSVFCDNSGNVWAGTFNDGAVLINENRKPFSHIYHVPQKNSIPGNSIFAFEEDDEKRVWIGTERGLSVWDREKNTFETVSLKLNGKEWHEVVVSNLFIEHDTVWVGTSNGLVKYNVKTKTQHHYNLNGKNNSLSNNYIDYIQRDSKNNLWVATRYGLNRLNEKTNRFHNYYADGKPNSLNSSLIWRVFTDSSNRVWVCTNNGLHLYDYENDNFKVFKFEEGKNGIMSNDISDMIEARKDLFWLATSKGISVFDFKKGEIVKNIGVEDGLANGYIYRLLQTDDEIWVSSNKGLAVLDMSTFKVKALYFDHDGIQCNEFNTAALKLSDGLFLFGGVKGVTGFYPDKILNSDFIPSIYFTGLSVNGRELSINKELNPDDFIFNKDIVEASAVIFDPNERMFSFRFAALDYSNPEQVEYFYRLLPESEEWVPLGKRNTVTFVNLNPGKYQLQVRSTNGDGVLCDNVKSIKIIVEPPFWKKKWLVGLGILLSFVIVLLIFKYRTYRLNKDKKRLEIIVSERTKQLAKQKDKLEELTSSLEEKVKDRTAELEKAKRKAEESDMLKSAFLSNMSHEIRTPMNAIMGFSELLVTPGFDEDERRSFASMVKANGDTLLTLLNDIIDISMIESGQLKLNCRDVELYELVQSINDTFSNSLQLHEKRGKVKLILKVADDSKSVVIRTDSHRLMQILNNLVGNALKFTTEGFVEFGYDVQDDNVSFFVRDTGIGIGETELENIFKRFYKMQNGKTNFYPGNGLGLTITKNLVEALNGNIRVESELGKGTVFRFTVPL